MTKKIAYLFEGDWSRAEKTRAIHEFKKAIKAYYTLEEIPFDCSVREDGVFELMNERGGKVRQILAVK